MRLTILRAAVYLACLSLAGAQNQRALVLQHVTVIDGTGASPRQNQTVVISGTRIVAMGASGRIRVPKSAQTIDGSSRVDFSASIIWSSVCSRNEFRTRGRLMVTHAT